MSLKHWMRFTESLSFRIGMLVTVLLVVSMGIVTGLLYVEVREALLHRAGLALDANLSLLEQKLGEEGGPGAFFSVRDGRLYIGEHASWPTTRRWTGCGTCWAEPRPCSSAPRGSPPT